MLHGSACAQEASSVFSPAQIALQTAAATGQLSDVQRVEIKGAFDKCVGTTKRRINRNGDYYVDPRAGVSHASLDLMLTASLHCTSVDDIRRMRLHDLHCEHEAMFDDVIGIIERGAGALEFPAPAGLPTPLLFFTATRPIHRACAQVTRASSAVRCVR